MAENEARGVWGKQLFSRSILSTLNLVYLSREEAGTVQGCFLL